MHILGIATVQNGTETHKILTLVKWGTKAVSRLQVTRPAKALIFANFVILARTSKIKNACSNSPHFDCVLHLFLKYMVFFTSACVIKKFPLGFSYHKPDFIFACIICKLALQFKTGNQILFKFSLHFVANSVRFEVCHKNL